MKIMTFCARSFNQEDCEINSTTMGGARWYNPEEDEELDEEIKEAMNRDEDIASRIIMSSSTSESEGENEPDDGTEINYDCVENEQGALSEEEHDKNRSGKVFLNGTGGSEYRSSVQKDNKSSSDESERNRKFHVYITSFEPKNQPKVDISVDKFKQGIADSVRPFRVQQVRCGILVTLNKAADLDKILKLNFSKIFGGAVQIANISKNDPPYRKKVLFKTIPWVITLKEIRNCLEKQGIRYGKVKRMRNIVRVEVSNANHEERLLREGLNFYNTVTFSATPDIPQYSDRCRNKEIIQCYKCQGFWHTATNCKNEVKCVRCGEHHEVEKCKKPKSNPMCCNCHGAHHAAYKLCPTRLRMMSYINLKYRTVPRQSHFLTRGSTS